MPAARYWRAVGLQAVGGGALELSALHLYLAGARVDAAATLTSTIAPSSGQLSALQDDDTASAVRWLDVSAPGFALVWDFGAAQDVNALRLGAGALESEFLQALALQHSSDGAAWTTLTSVPAFAWPGAGVMQPVPGDGDGDPHFDKVSLLLHMDGADGSTTFTDSSPRPKTVTAIGNAKISTAQGLFGGASGYFDGSGDALSIAHAADLNLASGDWTIEFWFYLAGNFAGAYIIDKDGVVDVSYPSYGITVGSGGVALHLGSGNGLSGLQSFSGTTAVSANAWHRAAFGRAGSTIYGFLDGVQQFASTQTVAMVDGGKKINIGARYDGSSFPMCGYVKDLRITKGEARYTANFTPPTAPFPDSLGGAAPAAPPAPRGIAQAPAIVLSGGASAPAGPVLAPAAITRDMQDSGGYCIYGTTELDADPTDVPVHRRVQIYHQRDGRLVRETWSDAATGAYRFDHIRGGDGTRYFVVAFDHAGDKRAVIADNLLPEVMP